MIETVPTPVQTTKQAEKAAVLDILRKVQAARNATPIVTTSKSAVNSDFPNQANQQHHERNPTQSTSSQVPNTTTSEVPKLQDAKPSLITAPQAGTKTNEKKVTKPTPAPRKSEVTKTAPKPSSPVGPTPQANPRVKPATDKTPQTKAQKARKKLPPLIMPKPAQIPCAANPPPADPPNPGYYTVEYQNQLETVNAREPEEQIVNPLLAIIQNIELLNYVKQSNIHHNKMMGNHPDCPVFIPMSVQNRSGPSLENQTQNVLPELTPMPVDPELQRAIASIQMLQGESYYNSYQNSPHVSDNVATTRNTNMVQTAPKQAIPTLGARKAYLSPRLPEQNPQNVTKKVEKLPEPSSSRQKTDSKHAKAEKPKSKDHKQSSKDKKDKTRKHKLDPAQTQTPPAKENPPKKQRK
jgi:hypothetical protein